MSKELAEIIKEAKHYTERQIENRNAEITILNRIPMSMEGVSSVYASAWGGIVTLTISCDPEFSLKNITRLLEASNTQRASKRFNDLTGEVEYYFKSEDWDASVTMTSTPVHCEVEQYTEIIDEPAVDAYSREVTRFRLKNPEKCIGSLP